jgi:hypothetical protein
VIDYIGRMFDISRVIQETNTAFYDLVTVEIAIASPDGVNEDSIAWILYMMYERGQLWTFNRDAVKDMLTTDSPGERTVALLANARFQGKLALGAGKSNDARVRDSAVSGFMNTAPMWYAIVAPNAVAFLTQSDLEKIEREGERLRTEQWEPEDQSRLQHMMSLAMDGARQHMENRNER